MHPLARRLAAAVLARAGLAAALAALALPPAACTGVAAPRSADQAPASLSFELLGVAELAKTTPLHPAPVGGLSALAWQPSTGLWYAVSDDAGDDGRRPRFVTLRIALADGRLGAGGVEVVGVTPLTDVGGRPFAPGSVDPEGLALTGHGTMWLSSEGAADRGIAPWIREARLDGVPRRALTLPEHYLPYGEGDDQRGIRHNYGFEALTLTPDGRRLVAATEVALAQDGPRAVFGVPSLARVLVFDAHAGELLAEHVYEVDAAPLPAAEAGGAEIAGLVELLALDDRRLLALERAYVEGHGNSVRLYETSLAGADEVTGARRLPRRVEPMEKRLLLDFASLGVELDNVEGMALGPALPDGRRTLVFVSDDNFAWHQKTLFYAFAVSGAGIPPAPAAVPTAAPSIGELQGAVHRSPFTGREVSEVAGVVTAVAPPENERGGGFWIEDPEGDGDPATSDGLWVAAPSGPGLFAVAPGDAVRVSGRVAEVGFPDELTTTTLLAEPAAVRVVSRGKALPGPRRIGAADAPAAGYAGAAPPEGCPPRPAIDDDGLETYQPAEDGIDFWESLEGMRVELVAPLAVGPTSRFGEIPLVAASCAPNAGRTGRGGLLVAAGDFHPERLIADDRLAPRPPEMATGDRFAAPLVGVVGYAFGNFRLLATGEWPAVEPLAVAPERVELGGDPRDLTVATLNVENLSARDGDEKLRRLAAVVVEALAAPAIVALQEVQDDSGRDDDGTVTAAATLDRLAAAIAAAGGPAYAWRQVDPEDNADGGAPGGNIRVAFLVDPARARTVDRGAAGPRDGVEVVAGEDDGSALAPSPGRVAPTDPAFAGDPAGGERAEREPSRKPLALEVEVAGRPLFLVAVHFRSKGGDDPLFGAVQPPRLVTEPQRVAQAEAVAAFVGEILAADPEARVLVLGDFNDFAFHPPLAALEAVGLVNLVERLPPADRYTYLYEGNSQVLDHLLASPALAAALADVDAVHLHADFPPSRRASDHDPVVARFRWPSAVPAP
jgi:predicted extracellular nuclease